MPKTNCNKCQHKTDSMYVSTCTSQKCKAPEMVSQAAKEKALQYLKMHGTKAAKYMQTHFQ